MTYSYCLNKPVKSLLLSLVGVLKLKAIIDALSGSRGTHIVAKETSSPSGRPKLTLFLLGVALSGVFRIERRGVVGYEPSEPKDPVFRGVSDEALQVLRGE